MHHEYRPKSIYDGTTEQHLDQRDNNTPAEQLEIQLIINYGITGKVKTKAYN